MVCRLWHILYASPTKTPDRQWQTGGGLFPRQSALLWASLEGHWNGLAPLWCRGSQGILWQHGARNPHHD